MLVCYVRKQMWSSVLYNMALDAGMCFCWNINTLPTADA